MIRCKLRRCIDLFYSFSVLREMHSKFSHIKPLFVGSNLVAFWIHCGFTIFETEF